MKNVICFIIVLFVAACANTDKANEYAYNWSQTFRPNDELIAMECELSDSDGDGRVRCTLGYANDVEMIECPAGWLPQPFTTTCQGIKAGTGRVRR
jgi:hypothetical protein